LRYIILFLSNKDHIMLPIYVLDLGLIILGFVEHFFLRITQK